MLSYQKCSQVWELMMTSLFRTLKASSVDCLLLSQDGSFGINKHKRAREQRKAKFSIHEAYSYPSKYNRNLIWNYQQLKDLSRSYTSYSLLHMCQMLSLIMASCLWLFSMSRPSHVNWMWTVDQGSVSEPDFWTLATTALQCVNEKVYLYIYISLQTFFFGRKPHSWY